MSFFITLVENSDASRRAIETLPKVQAMIHKGLDAAGVPRVPARPLPHRLAFLPGDGVAAARCDDRLKTSATSSTSASRRRRATRTGCWRTSRPWAAMSAARTSAAPSAPVQAMIGFNYYAAERVHPCSVLGHALRARGGGLSLRRQGRRLDRARDRTGRRRRGGSGSCPLTRRWTRTTWRSSTCC